MDKTSAWELGVEYAQKGISAFPIVLHWDSVDNKLKKSPLARNAHQSATTDVEELRGLFRKADSHLEYLRSKGKVAESKSTPLEWGIGLCPGKAGYAVIDVDLRSNGLTNYESLGLADTAYARTASGGNHHWWKKDKKYGNAHNLPSGIDVRADDGWVVAPGVTSVYGDWTWIVELSRALDLPPEISERLGSASIGTEAATVEDIETYGPNMYEYMFGKHGGWGPRVRLDERRPLGGSIELSAPDRAWHQGCSVGGIGYDRVHFYTASWPTGRPVGDPAEFFPLGFNGDLDEVRYFVETGEVMSKTLRVEQNVTINRVKLDSRSLADRFASAFKTLDEVENFEPPEFLVDKFLVRDTIAQLFGDPASFKSFVAVDWLLCVASGKDWHGHEVKKPEPVVYIIGEGRSGAGKRVKAWQSQYGRLEGHHRDNFHLMEIPFNLARGEEVKAVLPLIEQRQPALIVIDTLARATVGADGNGDKDMGVVIEHLEQIRQATGACVMVVHHSGHTNKERGRGSSTVPGALTTNIAIKRQNMSITLNTEKQKEHDDDVSVKLQLQKVELTGDENGSLVVVDEGSVSITNSDEPPNAWFTPTHAQAIRVFESIYIDGETVSATQWQKQCEADGVLKSSSFWPVRKDLADNGLIAKQGRGYILVSATPIKIDVEAL